MVDPLSLLINFGPLAFGGVGFLYKSAKFVRNRLLKYSRRSAQPSYDDYYYDDYYYDPYYYTHITTTYLPYRY